MRRKEREEQIDLFSPSEAAREAGGSTKHEAANDGLFTQSSSGSLNPLLRNNLEQGDLLWIERQNALPHSALQPSLRLRDIVLITLARSSSEALLPPLGQHLVRDRHPRLGTVPPYLIVTATVHAPKDQPTWPAAQGTAINSRNFSLLSEKRLQLPEGISADGRKHLERLAL